jgi:hypothetical protein
VILIVLLVLEQADELTVRLKSVVAVSADGW